MHKTSDLLKGAVIDSVSYAGQYIVNIDTTTKVSKRVTTAL